MNKLEKILNCFGFKDEDMELDRYVVIIEFSDSENKEGYYDLLRRYLDFVLYSYSTKYYQIYIHETSKFIVELLCTFEEYSKLCNELKKNKKYFTYSIRNIEFLDNIGD